MAELPLVRRFPALSEIPRAAFGTFPTPVERVALGDGRTILVKRDDLSAGRRAGGNKIRGLEWLMGDVEAISIRPVRSRASRFTLSQEQFQTIAALSLLVFPQALAVVGVLVWARRRSAKA